MRPESLLIAAGITTAMIAAATVLAPVLAADMRRSVERIDAAPPDLTARALMVLGGCLCVGVPAAVALLWMTWR